MPSEKFRLNVILNEKEYKGFELVCPSHGQRSRIVRQFINNYIKDNLGARSIEVQDQTEQLELELEGDS
jgi:hypothetical protein